MDSSKDLPPDQRHLRTVPGVVAGENTAFVPKRRRSLLLPEQYVKGVLEGDRMVLGRALSLVESVAVKHRPVATKVLDDLRPHTGQAIRLGISGVPGAGKSTFIEAFAMRLIRQGHRVAVLAVDPSSNVTGGSILGDKTRMAELSRSDAAIVRPSASGTWAGGVARSTREAMLVCEAAGFDVVIVETVGVGQGETQAASMVDFFLILSLAGAGDELQGMKRGILELADAIAVNKADGENVQAARSAQAQLQAALRLVRSPQDAWQPKVLTCSALTGAGLDEIWELVQTHHDWGKDTGALREKRRQQNLYWMRQAVEGLLRDRFERDDAVRARLPAVEKAVLHGEMNPFAAAEELVGMVFKDRSP